MTANTHDNHPGRHASGRCVQCGGYGSDHHDFCALGPIVDDLVLQRDHLVDAITRIRDTTNQASAAAGADRLVSVAEIGADGANARRCLPGELPDLAVDAAARGAILAVGPPTIADLSADLAEACGLPPPVLGGELELTAAELVGEHQARPGVAGCARCATPYGPPHTPCLAHGVSHCARCAP